MSGFFQGVYDVLATVGSTVVDFCTPPKRESTLHVTSELLKMKVWVKEEARTLWVPRNSINTVDLYEGRLTVFYKNGSTNSISCPDNLIVFKKTRKSKHWIKTSLTDAINLFLRSS
jgi:hypothetical protein